jgi:GNAT superfamily N-acetyltransferase
MGEKVHAARPVDTVRWDRLSGAEFEEALSGTFDANWKRTGKPWLDQPKLKYYMPRSVLCRGEDTRVFFMATVDSTDAAGKANGTRTAIGVLEVESHEEGSATLGIKYVSVSEAWRRNGVATRLYQELAGHLRTQGLKLYRTRPGQETPEDFTQAVTKLLDAAGVTWFTWEI